MRNKYIEVYKNDLTNGDGFFVATLNALESLIRDREAFNYSKRKKWFKKIGWRGSLKDFKLFYNPEITASNMIAVKEIFNAIKELESEEKFSLADIVPVIQSKLNGLSNGETKQFFTYLLNDLHGNGKIIPFKNLSENKIIDLPEQAINSEKINELDWQQKFYAILKRKNLDPNMFNSAENTISFSDPLSEHVKWAFNHIYKIPYIEKSNHNFETKIARYYHGIEHVTRAAAIYAPVFINLFRKYGDSDALKLTMEDLKLIQIGLIFHDAAREGEGKDKWDHESGLFVYFYLTRLLKIDKKKAKLVAEAVANKDRHPDGYFIIDENEYNEVSWCRDKFYNDTNNIYLRFIHDPDSLDIIRARDHFDANHLYFYQQISNNNNLSLEEMADVITEARSLIETQGDGHDRTKPEIKEKYEHENCYEACKKSLTEEHHILRLLSNGLMSQAELQHIQLVDLTPYDKSKGLTEKNLKAAAREGKVIARSVTSPSTVNKKLLKSGKSETLAEKEIRKTMREIGVSTSSSKQNKDQKSGNEKRSVSMVAHGAGVFGNSGFLIIDPDIDAIKKISLIDVGTGRGKKNHLKDELLTRDEKNKKLKELNRQLKMGGSTVRFKGELQDFAASHVEILYDITQYHAIYYSNDPNLYNKDVLRTPDATHKFSPLLQAIFNKKQYEKQYEQEYKKRESVYIARYGVDNARKKFEEKYGPKDLPVFEYSGLHNRFRRVSDAELTNENIIQMWLAMTSEYIQNKLADYLNDEIVTMSVDDIKTLSMYKEIRNKYAKDNAPADSNYDSVLQQQVTQAIENERQRQIQQWQYKVLRKMDHTKNVLEHPKLFFNLKRFSQLMYVPKEKIKNSILEAINSNENLFQANNVSEFFADPTFSKSYLNKFLVDKEHLLKTNRYVKKIVYRSKAMKIYILAKELNLKEFEDEILQRAAEMLKNAISDVQDKLDQNGFAKYNFGYEYNEIQSLLNFSAVFDLTSAFNDQLNDVIDKIFAQISSHAGAKHEAMIYYKNFVSDLNQVNRLSQKNKEMVKDILEIHLNQMLSVSINDFGKIALYLYLAKISNAEIKDVFMQWIKNRKRDITSSDTDLQAIAETFPFNDVNLDLFEELIKHWAVNDSPKYLQSVVPSYWIKTILEIENYLPNKTFSNQQKNIIAENWKIVWDDFVSYCLDSSRQKLNKNCYIEYVFDAVTKEMTVILNRKDFPLQKELFAKTLKPILKEMITAPWSLTPTRMDMILKLHQELPFQDRRQKIIDEMLKVSNDFNLMLSKMKN